MNLRSIFPTDIATLPVAAPGLPEGTVGWTRESCRRAFAILGGTKIAVVSIDVYDHVHWGFEPSGEAWRMYRRIPGELASDFALRSRREAQGWVEAFEREEVLFVIEFTAQDTAAEARKIVDDEQVD